MPMKPGWLFLLKDWTTKGSMKPGHENGRLERTHQFVPDGHRAS